MAGHSKWATTKHKKAANDAKRGKLFARLVKNIEVAARTGGGDPAANPSLYDAIQKAKRTSVPADNIERAVSRGSGAESGGADYQNILYEGYGPGGVAVLIECLTDNKNRAASDVRLALNRNGGSLADPGSVSYMFHRQGLIEVPAESTSEDKIFEVALEAGAEDVERVGDIFLITSEPADMVDVRVALQEKDIDYNSAEVEFVASTLIPLDAEGARKVLRLIDALEDSDDVQNVFTNLTVSDAVQAELEDED